MISLPRRKRERPVTRGQRAGAQLPAEGLPPELGMGQPKIVELLGDMVGEFIAQRKTQPVWRAVLADQIKSDDLRLLAAILCEGG